MVRIVTIFPHLSFKLKSMSGPGNRKLFGVDLRAFAGIFFEERGERQHFV